MAKKQQDHILEIEGVWTVEDIKNLKDWISGAEGSKEFEEQQTISQEQSKEILEIAHVDIDKLKVPFTFNL